MGEWRVAFDEVRWRKERIGGGIVLLEAELVVYFRGEYHFNYNRGP